MNYYVYDRPAGTASSENPPRFTWMPKGEETTYRIEVYDSSHQLRYEFDPVPINFFTPDILMEPGSYTYRVLSGNREIVPEKAFSIQENASETPLP